MIALSNGSIIGPNDDTSRTRTEKIRQRQFCVHVFVFFFAITGIALLAISVADGDSVIRSSAMDFFKLWLGALISIVTIMVAYYFKEDTNKVFSKGAK